MRRRFLLTVGLAAVGLVAVVTGTFQELLHVAPGYSGTIDTGWGNSLNHEEKLLSRLALLGVMGAVASTKWKLSSIIPVAVGGVILFYPVRAILHYVQDPGLYTEVTTYDGTTMKLVLGAEPFLLIAGGILLITAGIYGWRNHPNPADNTEGPAEATATA